MGLALLIGSLIMGSWGFGNFQNDDADDLVDELIERKSFSMVGDLLTSGADSEEYLEAPEGAKLLVAIELVAAAKSENYSRLPARLKEQVKRERVALNQFSDLAKRALGRVLNTSELKELWTDSQHYTEWMFAQNFLSEQLNRK